MIQNKPKYDPDPIFRTAVVTGVSATWVYVKFDDEESSSEKLYRRMYSGTITVGKRVLMAKMSGSYICLGALA